MIGRVRDFLESLEEKAALCQPRGRTLGGGYRTAEHRADLDEAEARLAELKRFFPEIDAPGLSSHVEHARSLLSGGRGSQEETFPW